MRAILDLSNEQLVRQAIAGARVRERFRARAKLAETEPHGTLLPEGNCEAVTDLIRYYTAPVLFSGGFYTGIRLHFARMCDDESWWKATGMIGLRRCGDEFLLQAHDDASVPLLKLSFDGKRIKRLRLEPPRVVELRRNQTRGVRLA